MILIFLGMPGSGKGTQAKSFVNNLEAIHLSTGEMFRQIIDSNSMLGKEIKQIVNSGELVSDKLTIKVLKENFLKQPKDKLIVLDGFPRTLEQVNQLDLLLKELNLKVNHVIYFKIDKKVAIERITNRLFCPNCNSIYNLKMKRPKVDTICDNCGSKLIHREDDNLENVQKRFIVYNKKTKSLINLYKKRKILIVVNQVLLEKLTIEDWKKQIYEK